MKVSGLASVLLNVSDLERSRRFYGDLLGLQQAGGPDEIPASSIPSLSGATSS